MLDLSKIEAGQLTLALDDYSLGQIVRTAAAAVEPLARKKGLAFTTTVADDLPTGRGERRLTQVLLNIAGNAIKFTEVGSVDILAKAADGHFEIAVRDTGPVIAPKDQGLIFVAGLDSNGHPAAVMRLEANGYEVATAADGEEGLAKVRDLKPDLILLDIMMPKLDGISVVRMLKQDVSLRSFPVILVTAKADTRDVVDGLDAGGDDYLTKPFEHKALLARVRSMLRQKALHDTVEAQARRLQEQADQLAAWNQSLEQKVAEQVTEIERWARLRRFLPAQVADLIVAAGNGDALLQSHRREVTVVFCDLRGFTAFAETAEPEEVMTVLGEYHSCLGEQITRHGGTLERFVGDGILLIFNDPLPCADHTESADSMAVAMRDAIDEHSERWRKRGYVLGFGIGIARGNATIGRIGFEQRADYAVIGTVTNHTARLCEEAKSRQILVSQRVFAAVEPLVEALPLANCP